MHTNKMIDWITLLNHSRHIYTASSGLSFYYILQKKRKKQASEVGAEEDNKNGVQKQELQSQVVFLGRLKLRN